MSSLGGRPGQSPDPSTGPATIIVDARASKVVPRLRFVRPRRHSRPNETRHMSSLCGWPPTNRRTSSRI